MKQHFNLLAILISVFALACGDNERGETVEAKDEHSILLTAENGKPIGPEIKYMKEWKAFGWFTAKDRVEWDIDVEKSGEYDVFMEWSVDDKEAGKKFLIEAKSGQLTGTVEKTGSWETYKTEKVGTLDLEKGDQKIVFRSLTDFKEGGLLDLRQLRLVRK
jgi:neutral ceramidase